MEGLFLYFLENIFRHRLHALTLPALRRNTFLPISIGQYPLIVQTRRSRAIRLYDPIHPGAVRCTWLLWSKRTLGYGRDHFLPSHRIA